MAHPAIAFRLESEERALIDLAAATPSLLDGRCRAAGSGWRAIMGRDFADNAAGDRRRARGLSAHRLRRPADAQPRRRPAPVSLRQRPPGARQAAGRRGARRLPGFPGARPPSDGGAVPRSAARDGRRQRPSGQDRGPLPRCRHRARPDRRRAAHRARRPAGHRASTTVSDAALGAFRPHTGFPTPCRWVADGSARRRLFVGAARSRRSRRCSSWRRSMACRRAVESRPADIAQRQLSAGRRARAAARDLHRGADRRGHRDRRPACRA